MKAMDKKATIEKGLSGFLSELKKIRNEGLSSENYSLAREKMEKWKTTVAQYLRQSVAEVRGDQLEQIQPTFVKGNPSGSLRSTTVKYEAHIYDLLKEIAERPWAVLLKPLYGESVESEKRAPASGKRVFLVHGRDESSREEVARFLRELDLEPVILHEQVSESRTIIEKIEHYSDVDYAVILLTPDDVGKSTSDQGQLQPRARQNVVFEFGYFIGKMGRKKVCAVLEEGVERPSDIEGIVYVALDKQSAWKGGLARELEAAGLEVDLEKDIEK